MGPLAIVILTALLTMIIGPFVLYLLSYRFGPSGLPKFPVSEIDIYGFLIFMPLFNAIAIYYGILDIILWESKFLYAIIFSVVFTILYVIWRKNFSSVDDWSRPRKSIYNFGGWYYTGFMLVQTTFLFYSIQILYQLLAIWIITALFAVMVIGRLYFIYNIKFKE